MVHINCQNSHSKKIDFDSFNTTPFYYYLLSFPRVWTFVQCQLPYHHFLCTITITIKVLACSINSTVLRALGATCWPQIADQRGPHWKLSRNHHRAINRSDLDRQIEPNGERPSEPGEHGADGAMTG